MEYDEKDMYVEVAGRRCLRHDTTPLEAWFMMHSLRRVICGGEDFPGRHGKLAVFASMPLMQKEIDFIDRQCASPSGFLPIAAFMEQYGKLVGVVDYEVAEKTDLPGWDGTPNPVILSNPHWYEDGRLVPVPPDVIIEDGERRRKGRGREGKSRLRRTWR